MTRNCSRFSLGFAILYPLRMNALLKFNTPISFLLTYWYYKLMSLSDYLRIIPYGVRHKTQDRVYENYNAKYHVDLICVSQIVWKKRTFKNMIQSDNNGSFFSFPEQLSFLFLFFVFSYEHYACLELWLVLQTK